jgi:hypothetical protein
MGASSEALLSSPVSTALSVAIAASASPSQFMLSSMWTGHRDATISSAAFEGGGHNNGAAKIKNPRPHEAAGDFELKEPGSDQYSQTFMVRRR